MAKNALCDKCAYDADLCMCRTCKDASSCTISTVEETGACKYFMTEAFWK